MSSEEAAQKEAIRKELSAQKIPLKLTLAANEVSTLTPPTPVYTMASRHSYLPCVAMQLLQHFQAFLPPGDDTPWFDFNGVPLKWHIPIGTLYDLLHHAAAAQSLPWCLTIHYRSLPEEHLLRCDGDASARDSFLNALKEAAFVLTGSASGVMSAGALRETLWGAVAQGRVEDFRSAVTALNIEPALRGEKRTRIPVKLLVSRIPKGAQWSWEFAYVTSRPIDASGPTVPLGSGNSSSSSSGSGVLTLLDALRVLLPEEFPSDRREGGGDEPRGGGGDGTEEAKTQEEPQGGEGDGGGEQVGREEAAGGGSRRAAGGSGVDDEGLRASAALPPHMRVMVSGVEPPPEAPLAWLHANLKHPDHFLYIVVHLE